MPQRPCKEKLDSKLSQNNSQFKESAFSEEHLITADIDNNGYLDKHDFECMALRMTLLEGKGEFNYNRYQENLHIMLSLWEEIANLADFDKVRLRDIVSTYQIAISPGTI